MSMGVPGDMASPKPVLTRHDRIGSAGRGTPIVVGPGGIPEAR